MFKFVWLWLNLQFTNKQTRVKNRLLSPTMVTPPVGNLRFVLSEQAYPVHSHFNLETSSSK